MYDTCFIPNFLQGIQIFGLYCPNIDELHHQPDVLHHHVLLGVHHGHGDETHEMRAVKIRYFDSLQKFRDKTCITQAYE